MKRMTKAEFEARGAKIHAGAYDYSKIIFKNTTTKINIICAIHGEFKQTPKAHLSGQGCPICGKLKSNKARTADTSKFIQAAQKIHGDKYDYSKTNYTGAHCKLTITCAKHGDFNQSANSHLQGHGCIKCANRNKKTSLDFINDARRVHGNKYDYSKTNYTGAHCKLTITCSVHGDFNQSANSHIKGRGCSKCGNNITNALAPDLFITRAQKIHGDKYDYSKTTYTGAHEKVIITCPVHGDFMQIASNHIHLGQQCPKCVCSGTSKPEIEIQEFVKSLNIEIETNNRTVLNGMELDIYIPSKNIAIEFNGLYWHSSKFKAKKYHLNKTEACEKQGIQLIHIFEDEWLNQKQIVKNRLKSLLGKTKYSVFARKCVIKEIGVKEKNKFLNKYHIQGEDKSKIKLGLFYKTRLVAVMTFGKSRFNKNAEWELIRYCTVANFRILGGAGKLLKHFERNYNPESIISYADRRWSVGNVYKQLGFNRTHSSSPNYFYIIDRTRKSRHQFMKHKLKEKLEVFNPELSECENMLLNGVERIFDCGTVCFIK